MSKYLLHVNYTVDGAKGLKKEGGTGRRDEVKQILERVGGRLDGFYYAFGEADVIVIADLPDAVTAAALSLAINAAGAAHLRTTPLLSPEEMDEAARKQITYRPPGS